MPRLLKAKAQVVMKNGKPDAVIIDIRDYQNSLERLEDKEDLADLEKMRKGGLHFRKFESRKHLTNHSTAWRVSVR